ncbi:MAG: response regulator transcription factor [Bacteroidales bacterium]
MSYSAPLHLLIRSLQILKELISSTWLGVLRNVSEPFMSFNTGLEFLTANPADIVLMDIHLPGMDGIECVRQLKSIHPEMQFIMCTIFQNDDSVFNALKAGATGYLLKNDDPGQIIDAIHELHAGGSPMTPQIARCVIESFKRPSVNDDIHLLTKREAEILGFLAKCLRYKEIADKLCISTETVRKRQVQSRCGNEARPA